MNLLDFGTFCFQIQICTGFIRSSKAVEASFFLQLRPELSLRYTCAIRTDSDLSELKQNDSQGSKYVLPSVGTYKAFTVCTTPVVMQQYSKSLLYLLLHLL